MSEGGLAKKKARFYFFFIFFFVFPAKKATLKKKKRVCFGIRKNFTFSFPVGMIKNVTDT